MRAPRQSERSIRVESDLAYRLRVEAAKRRTTIVGLISELVEPRLAEMERESNPRGSVPRSGRLTCNRQSNKKKAGQHGANRATGLNQRIQILDFHQIKNRREWLGAVDAVPAWRSMATSNLIRLKVIPQEKTDDDRPTSSNDGESTVPGRTSAGGEYDWLIGKTVACIECTYKGGKQVKQTCRGVVPCDRRPMGRGPVGLRPCRPQSCRSKTCSTRAASDWSRTPRARTRRRDRLRTRPKVPTTRRIGRLWMPGDKVPILLANFTARIKESVTRHARRASPGSAT